MLKLDTAQRVAGLRVHRNSSSSNGRLTQCLLHHHTPVTPHGVLATAARWARKLTQAAEDVQQVTAVLDVLPVATAGQHRMVGAGTGVLDLLVKHCRSLCCCGTQKPASSQQQSVLLHWDKTLLREGSYTMQGWRSSKMHSCLMVH